MSEPKQRTSLVANTWIRQMHFEKAGDANCGHAHAFDHQTILAHGKFRVYVEDRVSDFEAPMVLFIKAGKEHKIEALEDNSKAFCVHAVRNGVNVNDIMNPDELSDDTMFGEETHPLIMGGISEKLYRTTTKDLTTLEAEMKVKQDA
jgi:quercetin dioxygenase-like cupin family protein